MRTRRLIVVTPEGERELLFIGRLSAGRAPECDISIADTKISRRHAEFDASGPIPRVTDLGSRNGILVNGRKVGSADLAPGDIVTIGDAQVRFEEQAAAAPAVIPVGPGGLDDRTAVLLPAHMQPPASAARSEAPSSPAGAGDGTADESVDLPLAPVPLPSSAPSPPAVLAPAAMPNDDRTAVLPRPVERRTGPPAASTAPASVPASPAAPAPALPTSARPLSPPAVSSAATGSAPSSGPSVTTPPPVAAPPVAMAPSAASGVAGAATAVPKASGGPRMSWGGFLTILVLLLGSIGVLLGVVPILSATSTTIDALATRQARTLVGWLTTAIRSDGTVDEDIVEAVRLQDGVASAVLVDARSGRVVAPSRMLGRTMTDLPAGGADWRTLDAPVVTVADGTTRDAVAPVRRGPVPHVAWIRYEPASGADSGLALVVALGSTLVLALAIVLLIKRHTAATLQFFTRQVELAVSGANAKVMQGTLVPGLERLPGIVSYLLEQRRSRDSDADAPAAGAAAGLHGDPSPSPAVAARPPEPAWLEITPSLSVASASPQAATGVAGWEAAVGRHLLDVLTDGPVRNAVVQGLGALGMAAGADVGIPVAGQAPINLRREPNGHVRVTFATR